MQEDKEQEWSILTTLAISIQEELKILTKAKTSKNFKIDLKDLHITHTSKESQSQKEETMDQKF
jgi:hypothetical protein